MNKLVFWLSSGFLGLALFLLVPEAALAQAAPGCPVGDTPANLAQALNQACNVSWSAWVFSIWRLTMSVVNVAVVLLVIAIALATVLHWNIDTYGFKKALPTLVIAVVLANFSLLIVRGMVDLANVLTVTFAGRTDVLARGIAGAIFGTTTAPIAGIVGYDMVGWLFIGPGATVGLLLMLLGAILVVLIPAIGFLILWFLLLIRLSVVFVFAAVSPLAFMALALPATQPWFKKWWGIMLNWVFMAPVVFLLLKIGSEVGEIANRGVNTAPGFVNTMIPFLIAMGALFMAIMAPFKMGGAIAAAGGAFMGFVAGTRKGGYSRTMFESAQKAGQARKAELYLRTPMGRLQTALDLRAGAAEKRLEGQKAATEAGIREQLAAEGRSIERIEELAEANKQRLESVKQRLLGRLLRDDVEFANTVIGTELEKIVETEVTNKIREGGKSARIQRRLDEIARLGRATPGGIRNLAAPLRAEFSRLSKLNDITINDDAKNYHDSQSAEGSFADIETLRTGGVVNDEYADGTAYTVTAADLENFLRGNFNAVQAPQKVHIETRLRTMAEYMKNDRDPHFETAVESMQELAEQYFDPHGTGMNPATGRQWEYWRNGRVPNRAVARELLALDIPGVATLGTARRASAYMHAGFGEETILDYLDPTHQQYVNRAVDTAFGQNITQLDAAVRGLPDTHRQAVISDASSIIHSHKTYLIRSTAGEAVLRRLSPEQQEYVVRVFAYLRPDGSNLTDVNRRLSAINPALQLKQGADLAQVQRSAVQVTRGLDNIRALRVQPQLAEYMEYVNRFRGLPQTTLTELKKNSEQAFLNLRAGQGLDKNTVEQLGRVLAQSGLPAQIITELKRQENHPRLLEVADKMHLAVSAVEKNLNQPGAVESHIRNSLAQSQLPVRIPLQQAPPTRT